MTNTETEAFEAMLAHHRALQENVGILVAALAGTAAAAEMIDEHRSLALAIEHLADASTGSDAARQAESISALFAAHVAKENELLLPSLLADDQVELAQLLAQMQRLTESSHEPSFTEDELAPDNGAVDHRFSSAPG